VPNTSSPSRNYEASVQLTGTRGKNTCKQGSQARARASSASFRTVKRLTDCIRQASARLQKAARGDRKPLPLRLRSRYASPPSRRSLRQSSVVFRAHVRRQRREAARRPRRRVHAARRGHLPKPRKNDELTSASTKEGAPNHDSLHARALPRTLLLQVLGAEQGRV
jgi:hypothetical protein